VIAAGGSTALVVVLVLSVVVPLVLLAIVSWIFWRARNNP